MKPTIDVDGTVHLTGTPERKLARYIEQHDLIAKFRTFPDEGAAGIAIRVFRLARSLSPVQQTFLRAAAVDPNRDFYHTRGLSMRTMTALERWGLAEMWHVSQWGRLHGIALDFDRKEKEGADEGP